MRYIPRLLAEPAREFHALDLVAGEHGGSFDPGLGGEHDIAYARDTDAGVLLDAEAREAYRRRLAEIDEDIEEATALQDEERIVQADAERDFLIRELARAVGLGATAARAPHRNARARA